MPILLLPMLAVAASQPASSTLEVEIDGLRSARGVIQACLTRDRANFPDCAKDKAAIRRTAKIGSSELVFTGVPPGDYALMLFHDENANSRLDTLFGIPREGFGFSRNPVVRFGAPRYEKVDIELAPGLTRVRVRLQYLL